MIKAILFDFDGVLTIDQTGSESIINYFAQKTGIEVEILKSSYYKHNKGLLCGEITHKDIWHEFCVDIGNNLDYNLLFEAFQNTRLDHEMLGFVRQLKKKYKIGMITDNKCDRIEEILNYNKLNSLFDVVSVSAAYHSGKEERIIFEKTISMLNVMPNECIFIDNTEKNLSIPRQMGMHTILFDDENRNMTVFRENLSCLAHQTI